MLGFIEIGKYGKFLL